MLRSIVLQDAPSGACRPGLNALKYNKPSGQVKDKIRRYPKALPIMPLDTSAFLAYVWGDGETRNIPNLTE